MPSAGFEPSIPASERPQTYALDPAATEILSIFTYLKQFTSSCIAIILTEYRDAMFTLTQKRDRSEPAAIYITLYILSHYTIHTIEEDTARV